MKTGKTGQQQEQELESLLKKEEAIRSSDIQKAREMQDRQARRKRSWHAFRRAMIKSVRQASCR